MRFSPGLIAALCLGAACVRAPPPPPRPTAFNVFSPPDAPTPRRLARAETFESMVLAVDDTGQVFKTGSITNVPWRWVPFSEPATSVVFLRHQQVRPGPGSAPLLCARLRSGQVECVIDVEPTSDRNRETSHVRPPFDGAVLQLGVAEVQPWEHTGALLCGRTARGAQCFSFAFDGLTTTPAQVDADRASAGAAGISVALARAWRAADPTFDPSRIDKLVRTEASDQWRLTPPEPNGVRTASTACARFVDGALRCFGPNAYALLGDGTTALAPRVHAPVGAARVLDVSASGHRLCAVFEGDEVRCWGEVSSFPLRRPQLVPVPACRLERGPAQERFARAREQDEASVRACAQGCASRQVLDACLACVPHCIPLDYDFVHTGACQEPRVESSRLFARCAEPAQSPYWLADGELAEQLVPLSLVPTPTPLDGPARLVVLLGHPELCVVRPGGALECFGQDRRWTPVVAR